ncbi:MAG: hypothetical protein RL489_89 [Pseudomonadota bacterium]
MTTLATRMRALGDLESFDVEVIDKNGQVVDAKTTGFAKFDFEKRATGSTTVNDWKERRFKKTYPGYDCRVLQADGTVAHGNTKLETVRGTYEE